MSTSVRIGSGSQLWLDNASGVLTQLSEIISISCPNPQTADVEATHMASTAREFIAGLTDYGDGSFQMNYIPNSSTDQLIRTAISDKAQRTLRVILPISDGSTQVIDCECIVKGYERSDPIDDRMTATMTVRFTGAPTETHV